MACCTVREEGKHVIATCLKRGRVEDTEFAAIANYRKIVEFSGDHRCNQISEWIGLDES